MDRMSIFKRFADWFRRTPPAQFAVWTATGIIVWKLSATVVQDILVYGAFLFALAHAHRGARAWKQPAGIAFVAILLYMACALPFSTHPALSLRDFSGLFKIIAGAFAIPVIFNTRAKIEAALFYSAAAITCVLGYDLIRLTVCLGPNLLAQAHIFKPFILNHSNVASMMAGASIFVFFQHGFHAIAERTCRPSSGVRSDPSSVACPPKRSGEGGSVFSGPSSVIRRPSSIFSGLPSVSGCLLGILVGLAYLVILASRGPQIAFALTCVGALSLVPGRGIKLLGFLVVLLAGLALFVNIEHVNPRFLEKKSMTNFSERVTVWRHTWDLARQRPWVGYGYGKRNFEAVYYSTHPPKSIFHYPHPHQFWLKLLFEFGWPGLILNFIAWLILAHGLWRCVFAQPTFTDRLLPGTVGLVFCFIHLYGLGDYPDNIVLMAQFWLIPVALALMKTTDNEHTT